MNPSLVQFVEHYGLLAIFAGCIAEGESFAVLGGFLAHQGFFQPWSAFAAMFAGAFLGDTFFYLAGRFFSTTASVRGLRQRPGFERVLALVKDHPAKFVILNRYAYGFRLIGGVASGMADIPAHTFIGLNALSSLIWAALFGAIGWFFGLGVETLLGDALHKHHRLLIGIAIGVAVAVIGAIIAHRYAAKGREES